MTHHGLRSAVEAWAGILRTSPTRAANWKALALALVSMHSATTAFGAEAGIPIILGPRIGPVLLGFTRSQVEAELGKPDRVVSTGDALKPELRYPGLTISLQQDGKVAMLRSTNPKYCLAGNICPGASAASVLASIGSPQEGQTLRTGLNTYPVLFNVDEKCWAELTLEQDAVAVVEVKCRPQENSR